MTEARATLAVAEKRWLDEPCARCGHQRRRHLYSEGACVYAAPGTVTQRNGKVVVTAGVKHCHCPGYEVAKTEVEPAVAWDE